MVKCLLDGFNIRMKTIKIWRRERKKVFFWVKIASDYVSQFQKKNGVPDRESAIMEQKKEIEKVLAEKPLKFVRR